MSLRYYVFHEHPNLYIGTASVLTSVMALTTLPSLPFLVLHLAILLIYMPKVIDRRTFTIPRITGLWFGISLARSLSWFTPSLHALSTPAISILVLLGQSMATSLISLTAVFIYTKMRTRLSSALRVTIFPALWTGVWYLATYVSPVGYLTSWTPATGTALYDWMIPFLSPGIKDWLVAAWAVVCSQAAEQWIMESRTAEEAPLIEGVDSGPSGKRIDNAYHRGMGAFTVFLVALAAPSYFVDNPNGLPSQVTYPYATTLGVGCVLPPFYRYKHHNPTLKDYIIETKKLASQADILLWPEGAVSFADEAERNAAFDEIRLEVPGALVGVSFEETFADSNGQNGHTRTGLALISKNSEEPHLLYYKRHLVPIAESFALTASDNEPSIYSLPLRAPKDIRKPDWGDYENDFTRPIPLTASICLDLAMPAPFSSLETRPALILAPGRTWETSVGQVMWYQAKQRAYELGSAVLWCDGGDGGVSGVAGRGISETIQVGRGSWVRKIGIEYPFLNERLTFYGREGNWLMLVLIFLPFVVGSSESVIQPFVRRQGWGPFLNVKRRFVEWRERRRITNGTSTATVDDLI